MEVRKCTLVAMKGEKVKNLYKMIGKTIVDGAMKVDSCLERSSITKRSCKSERVQKVEGDN